MAWMGKTKSSGSKRRRVEMEDDDDEGGPAIFPLVMPKLGGSASTVYSQFNHVYFNDEINTTTVFALNKELRQAETVVKTAAAALRTAVMPIYLHVTTNGGGIHAAFSVVDCIRQLTVPVYTVADGFVASAGTLLTLAGEKRYITENAYMLIHELRSGVWGKMTSIDEEYMNLKKVQDHITKFYTERTKLSKKCLEKVLTKDIIWNAEECLEKGLVDEVYAPGV